jgi:pantothenate kinase
MGMMKNYLLTLLQQCSEEQFGQNAIEWAIVSGLVHLSYELDADVRLIMLRYDEIIIGYRRSIARAPEELRKAPAPMRRAVPRRQIKDDGSVTSTKRKNAA